MISSPAPDPRPAYHFCTYFDRNYLTRGLALYHSLRTHCRRPFFLWTLCFDDETYSILSRLDLADMRLIRRQDFEAGDAELADARANRNAVEYFWTCTPSLPLYILRQDEAIHVITYLDADLFFYSDPQPIFDEFGDRSILIHGHRYAPEFAHFADTSGFYNVGLLSFRRDTHGLECLKWWRERCNEWCYTRFEAGKFGDQKYLDDWPVRFAGVAVLQHPGAGVAPWNITLHPPKFQEGYISVDDQPLIFYHFHGLRCVTNRLVSPATSTYLYTITPQQLQHLHHPYVAMLRDISSLTGLGFQDRFALADAAESPMVALLSQQCFLASPARISTGLWRYAAERRIALASLAKADLSISKNEKMGARRQLLRSLFDHPLLICEPGFLVLATKALLSDRQIGGYRKVRDWLKARLPT